MSEYERGQREMRERCAAYVRRAGHPPKWKSELLADDVVTLPLTPDATGDGLAGELTKWAADESNAIRKDTDYRNSTGEVFWCEFCSGDSYWDTKTKIIHKPDCLHLKAVAALRAQGREEPQQPMPENRLED
jgi:hypothetical protein